MKTILFSILFISVISLIAQEYSSFEKLNFPDNKELYDNLHKPGNYKQFSSFKGRKDNRNRLVAETRNYGDSPEWRWVNRFGGSEEDYSCGIVSDSENNIIIGGSFAGKISVETLQLTSFGHQDGIISKFDNAGNLIWILQLPTQTGEVSGIQGICLDDLNNIYVTGYYSGIIDFGTYTLPDNDEINMFFAKYSSSGEILIAVNYNTGWNIETGIKIQLDVEKNVYIVVSDEYGTESITHNSKIMKLDSAGDFVWLEQFIGIVSINDMVFTGDKLYIAGNIEEYAEIDGVILDPEYSRDAFIAKADTDGVFEWVAMAEHDSLDPSSAYSYGFDISVDSEENVYFIGEFSNNVIFGDYTITIGGGDGFLTKCSPEGDFLWLNKIFQECEDIALDEANNSYIHYYNQAFEINYVIKTNSNGVEQWDDYMDHTLSHLIFDNSGKIIGTGIVDGLVFVTQLTILPLTEDWFVELDGNSGIASVMGVETDSSGFFYTFGYVGTDIDYFGAELVKGLFLSKQDESGNIVWINQLPDLNVSAYYGNCVAVDPVSENIYITGAFKDILTIPDEIVLAPVPGGSIFVIKYGLDGSFKWVVQEDFNGRELCLAPDYSGNLLLSGTFYTMVTIGGNVIISAGNEDAFIAKYNSQGDLVWVKRAGGEYIDINPRTSVDGNDNVYFTGEFLSENITIDNTELILEDGDGHIVFSKFDPLGNVLWVTSLGASPISYENQCWPTFIKTDRLGYSYIKGWHGDSASFNDIILYSPYGSGYSWFIAKFDPEGNTMWANSIRMHQWAYDFNQMDVDIMGNCYLGANIRDTIHFGDDYDYINVGEYDLFVAKYSSHGDLSWVKTIEGSAGFNWLSGIAVYDTTKIYAGGFFNHNLSFDEQEIFSLNSNGFVALLDEDYLNIVEVSDNNKTVSIFPNPTDGMVSIKGNQSDNTNLSVEISDITGKIILEELKKKGDIVNIDLSEYPQGVYIVKVSGMDYAISKKVIVY